MRHCIPPLTRYRMAQKTLYRSISLGFVFFLAPFQFRADQLELLPRYVAFVIMAECSHACPSWGSSLTCHGDLEQPLRSSLGYYRIYVEPFLGGGAAFGAKDPSPLEVLNDTNGEIVNFYGNGQHLLIKPSPWRRTRNLSPKRRLSRACHASWKTLSPCTLA